MFFVDHHMRKINKNTPKPKEHFNFQDYNKHIFQLLLQKAQNVGAKSQYMFNFSSVAHSQEDG